MPSGSMGDVERHHCHWKKLWSCLIMVTNIKGTLPGTNIFAPAKIDGWNMRFPLGGKRPMFRGELLLGEFRFLMLSYSLCRIWTYESKTCTGLQSRKLAEAIFTFFNVEVSRKCVLQYFGILCFPFHMCIIQRYRVYIDILRFIRCNVFAICFT